jgi:hypothetical protein
MGPRKPQKYLPLKSKGGKLFYGIPPNMLLRMSKIVLKMSLKKLPPPVGGAGVPPPPGKPPPTGTVGQDPRQNWLGTTFVVGVAGGSDGSSVIVGSGVNVGSDVGDGSGEIVRAGSGVSNGSIVGDGVGMSVGVGDG